MCLSGSLEDHGHSEVIADAAITILVRGGRADAPLFPLHIRRLLLIAQRHEP